MESLRDFNGLGLVINELAQGRELAKKLQKLLDPSSPQEEREFLMNQILSIYNKALNLINYNIRVDPLLSEPSSSPQSTRSSNRDEQQSRPSKKRKMLPRRKEKVKLSNEEDQLPSDGHSWRKYGQKIINGAKFRRGYFRCTHRHSQGCSAVKQVQKSDEDPTVFDIIYVGEHTCTAPYHISIPSSNKNPPRVHPVMTQEPQNEAQLPQQTLPILQPKLTVQTVGLDNGDEDKFYFRSYSFSTLFAASPSTSGTDHLISSSPVDINGVWTPDSDPHEGFSAQNYGENSAFNQLEFTLEELGIDPNLMFNNTDMFS